jgi:D-3-phosphoglycerate dehydrogenase
MALLLAAARKILFYHRSVVQDEQWNWRLAQPIHRLRGRTLGLIGFGKIPRALAVRAMSFGCGWADPPPPTRTKNAGVSANRGSAAPWFSVVPR